MRTKRVQLKNVTSGLLSILTIAASAFLSPGIVGAQEVETQAQDGNFNRFNSPADQLNRLDQQHPYMADPYDLLRPPAAYDSDRFEEQNQELNRSNPADYPASEGTYPQPEASPSVMEAP